LFHHGSSSKKSAVKTRLIFSSGSGAQNLPCMANRANFRGNHCWHNDCAFERSLEQGGFMNMLKNQQGAIGWILLWAIGIPIPILLLLFMVRGCT
jgi:hypothetical protein